MKPVFLLLQGFENTEVVSFDEIRMFAKLI